jgi:hypothetical protein
VLPVFITLAVEALSVMLRPNIELLWRSTNFLATLLEVSLLLFGLPSILKLVVLLTINTLFSFLIST